MGLKEFFKNLINSLLDGSFERMRIINQMNMAFEEFFTTGELNRFCKVSISKGRSEFAHEMSAFWFRSGFKISIENDMNLKESEVDEYSKYILSNLSFVRHLMAIGFDTLIIKGRNNFVGKEYALKRYANLNNYFLKE